jgi:HEPN domain-containing protein
MDKWEQRLLRAKNDLITSKKGLVEPKTLDTAAYHCQQCAEKSLKSYLNYKGIDTEDRKLRTHNLLMLLKACISENQEFENDEKSVWDIES